MVHRVPEHALTFFELSSSPSPCCCDVQLSIRDGPELRLAGVSPLSGGMSKRRNCAASHAALSYTTTTTELYYYYYERLSGQSGRPFG